MAMNANTPSAANHTKTHAGIDKPRKVQSTVAHSPEPERVNGSRPRRYARPPESFDVVTVVLL